MTWFAGDVGGGDDEAIGGHDDAGSRAPSEEDRNGGFDQSGSEFTEVGIKLFRRFFLSRKQQGPK